MTESRNQSLHGIYELQEEDVPVKPNKLHLVWNSNKTECVAFSDGIHASGAAVPDIRCSIFGEEVRKHLKANDDEYLDYEVFDMPTNPNIGHSVSCRYQFELAFLNLQDTPELRKLYWSAMGASHFDDNDQIVEPELIDECPACKEINK